MSTAAWAGLRPSECSPMTLAHESNAYAVPSPTVPPVVLRARIAPASAASDRGDLFSQPADNGGLMHHVPSITVLEAQ